MAFIFIGKKMAICKNCDIMFQRRKGSRAKLCDECWEASRTKAYGTIIKSNKRKKRIGNTPLWIKIKGRGL